ncbi:hypothetical protein ACFSTI_18260 [Rhizorhabdus histidinilytica]|uniref:Uncharacterized protein n=1 Tax=Rhizorhabdus histidinilytica TaxID=439228 RepID=A0A1T5H1J5_9SPHN|nr:hypothetical protein [Rhizorhabdus histidinilytica]SKC14546.1 hypothetical protein SAMN06295920_1291 [Rhizorhabdus histidinilytica]
MSFCDFKRIETWVEQNSSPGKTIWSLVKGWAVQISFDPETAGAPLFRLATTSPWVVLDDHTFGIWESAAPGLDPEQEIALAHELIEQICADQRCEIDLGVEVEFAFPHAGMMSAFEKAFLG